MFFTCMWKINVFGILDALSANWRSHKKDYNFPKIHDYSKGINDIQLCLNRDRKYIKTMNNAILLYQHKFA